MRTVNAAMSAGDSIRMVGDVHSPARIAAVESTGQDQSPKARTSRALLYSLDPDLSDSAQLRLAMQDIGIEVIGCRSGAELERRTRTGTGCILLDPAFGDSLAFSAREMLRGGCLASPVIVATSDCTVREAVEWMKLGAIDVVQKPYEPADLCRAIDEASSWEKRCQVPISHSPFARELVGKLTKRQLDILKVALKGRNNIQIAEELGLSQRTVEMHRTRTRLKLGLARYSEVLVLATRAGLYPAEV